MGFTSLIVDGFDYFISGGAIGADQDLAEIVIKLKKRCKPIHLEIAMPCPNQDLKWCESDKERYKRILAKADFVNVLSTAYTPYCMQKRNEYMADKCELMLVVWNGEKRGGTFNTLTYLQKTHKPFRLITLAIQP